MPTANKMSLGQKFPRVDNHPTPKKALSKKYLKQTKLVMMPDQADPS